MHNQLEDIELWERIKLDDVSAYETLFNRYWEKVFKTAFHYFKDKDVCSDITHDIFLNIWNKRSNLNIFHFKQYLTTSARYHVYKKQKSLRLCHLEYVEDLDSVEHGTSLNSGETHINLNELENNISYLINQLPKRCKEIFVLSRYDNHSNTEIAEMLNISKRTVENQLTVALKHLRQHMKEIGFAVWIICLFR